MEKIKAWIIANKKSLIVVGVAIAVVLGAFVFGYMKGCTTGMSCQKQVEEKK